MKNHIALVKEVGERFRNPVFVKETVLDPLNVNPDPLYELHPPYWSDLTLAAGFPGVIVLLSQLDKLFPDERWDEAVHAHVMQVKETLESSSGWLPSSIFSGLAGICFSLQEASREGTRYQKFLSTLNAILSDRLKKHYLDPLSDSLKHSQFPSPVFYELIQGISGVGLYCLRNLHHPIFFDMTQQIIALLISLMKPKPIAGVEVPGWYVPPELLLTDHDKASYPKGNFNLGLSHGITGVVAFLSVALENEIVAEGQVEAIRQGVAWIQKHRRQHNDRFFWPAFISLDEEIGESQLSSIPGKDAWCYGTPSVSRSLYLAGSALQDDALKNYALESFHSIFFSSPAEWNIPSPTMCHGLGGLLMMTHLMAQESGSPLLQEQTHRLEGMIIDSYRPEYPFGFVDLEPQKSGGHAKIHKAGLLEGSAGTLLTLLSTQSPSSTSWRLPFLVCNS